MDLRTPCVVAWIMATSLVAAACGTSPAGDPATTSTIPVTTSSAAAAIAPPSGPGGAELQALLDDARTAYGAPGALAVVRGEGSEWFGGSGTADLSGTPITFETRFRIASITKPIVAVLVLDAVARGELSLDALVADLLPGVVRPDPPITVRMVLDHTSGVFDIGNEGDPIADVAELEDEALRDEAAALVAAYEAGTMAIASDRLIVALAETHDRYFAPGAGYHYGNPNYQIAAMVLERVTGRPLATLLADRIAAPLGLTHTTIAPPDTASPELRGYGTSVDDGSLVDVTDDLLAFGNGGNGGIISTAGELLTIMQAIGSGRIVDRPLLEDMKTPTPQSGSTYGLGLATYDLTCGMFLGHEGGVNGTASIAIVSSDGRNGVVIALNLRDGTDPHLPRLADEMLCGSR